jgi:mannose-1-phosphate guanylyltransferase
MLTGQGSCIGARNHWGLVLAAGTRLQDYIRQVRGAPLPKQYVNFVGRRSMIEHTFERVEKLILPEKILTIVGKHHLAHIEVRRQLARRRQNTIIVQPANKETGPGILLPLMHIYKRCPDAIVSVFPSDHFILEEDRFMAHVDLAAQAVAQNPLRIVLLAIEAHSAEEEYGYVVPGEHGGEINLHGIRKVTRFVEKPNRNAAQELISSGALWNTMVMVFKVKTILQMIESIDSGMHREFVRIREAIGTTGEQKTIDSVYDDLQSINFSKGILENVAKLCPAVLSVLPVLRVFWSDWGSAQRLLATQELLGLKRSGAHLSSPKYRIEHELHRRFDRALAY